MHGLQPVEDSRVKNYLKRFWYAQKLLLPLFILVLLFSVGIVSGFSARNSIAGSYLSNLLTGKESTGSWAGVPNHIDLSEAKPGDILLAGNSSAAYGHFTHAGIIVDTNMLLEGYADCGIVLAPASRYRNYDWACLLRVQVSEPQQSAAVVYALAQQGKTFYPGAFKPNEQLWNCTKLIWSAYRQVGVDLDPNRDLWITPDALYQSPFVKVIASSGRQP